MKRLISIALSTAVLAALSFVSSPAKAEIPEILRPGQEPAFFLGGIGPSFYAIDRRGGGFTRFKLTQDIGYLFSGRVEGPAIGGHVSESFGDGGFLLQPAFKFWWDIPVVDNLGVTVAPTAKVGYALAVSSGNAAHAANWGFGCEGRLVLKGKAMVFIRPISLDMFFADPGGFFVNYDVIAGGGLIF